MMHGLTCPDKLVSSVESAACSAEDGCRASLTARAQVLRYHELLFNNYLLQSIFAPLISYLSLAFALLSHIACSPAQDRCAVLTPRHLPLVCGAGVGHGAVAV